MTEQPELEARVSHLEARLDALMAATRNVASVLHAETLRSTIVAALERQEVPAADALGLPFSSAAKYADITAWTGAKTVADERVRVYRCSEPAVTHKPHVFVRTTTARADVRKLRAAKGLT